MKKNEKTKGRPKMISKKSDSYLKKKILRERKKFFENMTLNKNSFNIDSIQYFILDRKQEKNENISKSDLSFHYPSKAKLFQIMEVIKKYCLKINPCSEELRNSPNFLKNFVRLFLDYNMDSNVFSVFTIIIDKIGWPGVNNINIDIINFWKNMYLIGLLTIQTLFEKNAEFIIKALNLKDNSFELGYFRWKVNKKEKIDMINNNPNIINTRKKLLLISIHKSMFCRKIKIDNNALADWMISDCMTYNKSKNIEMSKEEDKEKSINFDRKEENINNDIEIIDKKNNEDKRNEGKLFIFNDSEKELFSSFI